MCKGPHRWAIGGGVRRRCAVAAPQQAKRLEPLAAVPLQPIFPQPCQHVTRRTDMRAQTSHCHPSRHGLSILKVSTSKIVLTPASGTSAVLVPGTSGAESYIPQNLLSIVQHCHTLTHWQPSYGLHSHTAAHQGCCTASRAAQAHDNQTPQLFALAGTVPDRRSTQVRGKDRCEGSVQANQPVCRPSKGPGRSGTLPHLIGPACV